MQTSGLGQGVQLDTKKGEKERVGLRCVCISHFGFHRRRHVCDEIVHNACEVGNARIDFSVNKFPSTPFSLHAETTVVL